MDKAPPPRANSAPKRASRSASAGVAAVTVAVEGDSSSEDEHVAHSFTVLPLPKQPNASDVTQASLLAEVTERVEEKKVEAATKPKKRKVRS